MWGRNVEGIVVKTLQITIRDEDEDKAEAEYGEWMAGAEAASARRRYPERSSRLVVKIMNENDKSGLNLDICARRIHDSWAVPHQSLTSVHERRHFSPLPLHSEGRTESTPAPPHAEKPRVRVESVSEYFAKQSQRDRSHESAEIDDPLEHSLEKVRENNARIMENIQKLNRSFDNARKKELSGVGFTCGECGRSFVYESGLRRHVARHEAATAPTPRWQGVWSCGACGQVWPRKEQLAAHATTCGGGAVAGVARELKVSALLRCEFCEKVFTSVPRTVWHARAHAASRNYECSECEAEFASHRAAERHWAECRWVRERYAFTLPLTLLCDVCERRFRTADQLYAHRYKARHFLARCAAGGGSEGGVRMWVVVCEECGRRWPSAQHLVAHRERAHPPNIINKSRDSEINTFPNQYHINSENCSIVREVMPSMYGNIGLLDIAENSTDRSNVTSSNLITDVMMMDQSQSYIVGEKCELLNI